MRSLFVMAAVGLLSSTEAGLLRQWPLSPEDSLTDQKVIASAPPPFDETPPQWSGTSTASFKDFLSARLTSIYAQISTCTDSTERLEEDSEILKYAEVVGCINKVESQTSQLSEDLSNEQRAPLKG